MGPIGRRLHCLLGLVFMYWVRVRSYRLSDNGVGFYYRGIQVWPYSEIRDARFLAVRAKSPNSLAVTRQDGVKDILGGPWTKNVTCRARDFKTVSGWWSKASETASSVPGFLGPRRLGISSLRSSCAGAES